MICFMDRTFCSSRDCANDKCGRNFTPELSERAAKWWGKDDAPVAFGPLRDTDSCAGFVASEERS